MFYCLKPNLSFPRFYILEGFKEVTRQVKNKTLLIILHTSYYMKMPFFIFSSSHLRSRLSQQGRCVVTVQLSDEELAADDRGVDYFLLFAGSTQRHLTSTLRSSHDTLQALCPGEPPPQPSLHSPGYSQQEERDSNPHICELTSLLFSNFHFQWIK